MGKFDGILFCTDLDDTLLDKEKNVSKENLEAIEYFKNNGGTFTFVTGRTHLGIGAVLRQVEPNTVIGTLNGGAIYDHKKNKNIMEIEIGEGFVELLEFIDKEFPDIGFEVMCHDNCWICKQNDIVIRHINHEKLPLITCDYHNVPGKRGKVLIVGETHRIDALIPELKKQKNAKDFDFVRSTRHYYEILPKGSNKGNLLKEIAKINGIDISKTIAVGDNDNDLKMLEYAGCGFAVENATDSAKKAADRITVSNLESAIATIIKELDEGLIF